MINMNNKMLVIIYVPLLDEEYDIFIPINKKVGTIKKYFIENVDGLNNNDSHMLINEEDNKEIDNNVYIKNSGIKNGARLLLV